MAELPAAPPAAPIVAIELRLRYAHGLGGLAPYFAGLERGVAMATRCRGCRRTWFAPRLACICGGREMDWVELSGRGTVVAMTRGSAVLPGTRSGDEFVFALIQLDGADNRCFGRLGGASLQLAPGSAVWLSRAKGEWTHPAQCVEYIAEGNPAT